MKFVVVVRLHDLTGEDLGTAHVPSPVLPGISTIRSTAEMLRRRA